MANKYKSLQSTPAIDNANRRQVAGNPRGFSLAQQVELASV
ncbi:hypothetical protein [Chroococcidiopsis sp [FACHB-1243]]|nr:hypothetical protein [Chroococcidiopsis sp. [FACHB-1243]]